MKAGFVGEGEGGGWRYALHIGYHGMDGGKGKFKYNNRARKVERVTLVIANLFLFKREVLFTCKRSQFKFPLHS